MSPSEPFSQTALAQQQAFTQLFQQPNYGRVTPIEDAIFPERDRTGKPQIKARILLDILNKRQRYS